VGALTGVAQALFTGVPTKPAATYASGTLSAPSALACTWTSATALNLTWTDNSATFTSGYTVNRGTASGGPFSTTVGSTVGESSRSLADNAAAPPTLHYYVSIATHGAWSSANSAQVVSNACIATMNLVAGTTAGFSGDTAAATAAQLSAPAAVAVDASGNVYIADTTNNRIRKVTASTGIITTIAGGGTGNTACTFSGLATAVTLSAPGGVALDSSGNVYIADTTNNCVRKVVGTAISQVAGGGATATCSFAGAASSVKLQAPSSVAIDSAGRVVIADTTSNCVRLVTGANVALLGGAGGAGSTGDNGPAIAALLSGPAGVAANSSGDVWIADTANSRIRKVEGPV
jgi:sugar lactone lactonase YvrE